MATQRKSEISKARGEMSRGMSRLMGTLPAWARLHWRDLVMPWRRLPLPVTMALIGLVALAMILDTGENVAARPVDGYGVMIGADTVPEGTRCQEDEIITYRQIIGYDGVGCVHYEYQVMEFLNTCLIGNAEHGQNLASLHLRDQTFRSWCDAVVDDASDGMVTLADMLIDVGAGVAPAITSPTEAASPAPTVAPILPAALPNAGTG